jgi:anti-sigma B factor antagonist
LSRPVQSENPELKILVEREPGRHVLRLAGELDLTAAGRVLDAVTASCEEDVEELVIDVSALEFLDSSGLRAILDAATVCEEHMCEFSLRPARDQVSQQVRRLLEITGLFDRLPFSAEGEPEPQRPAGENDAA